MELVEIKNQLTQRFNASLSMAAERAANVKFQHFIPMYWFSSAVSQSPQMFISGQYYAVITTSQAYIEALGKFLCEKNNLKIARNDTMKDWETLLKKSIIQSRTKIAAAAIYDRRNDFHHLNKNVETDQIKLSGLALECLNNVYIIEIDVFAYSIENGKLTLQNPKYWPHIEGSDQVRGFIRNI